MTTTMISFIPVESESVITWQWRGRKIGKVWNFNMPIWVKMGITHNLSWKLSMRLWRLLRILLLTIAEGLSLNFSIPLMNIFSTYRSRRNIRKYWRGLTKMLLLSFKTKKLRRGLKLNKFVRDSKLFSKIRKNMRRMVLLVLLKWRVLIPKGKEIPVRKRWRLIWRKTWIKYGGRPGKESRRWKKVKSSQLVRKFQPLSRPSQNMTSKIEISQQSIHQC